MYKKSILLVLTVVLCGSHMLCQEDMKVSVDEILLSDTKLNQFSTGYKLQMLQDTLSETDYSTFTDLLRYQSMIFFRENGYGSVSSASFRGTSASQTAVVWNGININSQLTGQTDFNTLTSGHYQDIVIRSGGGSTQYASGAIGGSIHMNDVMTFNTPLSHEIGIGYGSYDTYLLKYQTAYGSDKLSVRLGVNYNESKNDFPLLDTDRRNENGEYKNINVNGSIGYFLAKTHILKLYHNTFLADRNFPATLTAPSDDNYKDYNSRSLVEWNHYKNSSNHKVRFAYLYEQFRYFPNKARSEYDTGHSKSTIAAYEYSLTHGGMKLKGIAEYTGISVEGSSILTADRNLYTATLLLSHQLSKTLSYGINLRQDIVSDYTSPFVYAVDAQMDISEHYSIQLNGSKNFRIPTFNDLYWSGPGAAGNDALIPETSLQAEIGQSLDINEGKLSTSIYYITTEDLIQWTPDATGIWSPDNLRRSTQYGIETTVDFNINLNKHSFTSQHQYAYTHSVNAVTKNQLIYTPLHKITSNIGYQYQEWGMMLQNIYNGSVYTTTDNTQQLPGYILSSIELNRTFHIHQKSRFTIAIKINNLFNKNYQTVAFRPMPNRNIRLQLNNKF